MLLFLAAAGYRQRTLFCVGGPYTDHVACVEAVASQLGPVVYPAILAILNKMYHVSKP